MEILLPTLAPQCQADSPNEDTRHHIASRMYCRIPHEIGAHGLQRRRVADGLKPEHVGMCGSSEACSNIQVFCDECETLSTIRIWSYPYNMRSGINQDLGCVIGRCTISQRFASVLPLEHAIPQKDRDLYSFKPRWVFATWFASYRASISVAVRLISCTAPIVVRLRPLPS